MGAIEGRGSVRRQRPAAQAANVRRARRAAINRNSAPPPGARPHADRAAVRLDDALDDVTGRGRCRRAVLAAPELREDRGMRSSGGCLPSSRTDTATPGVGIRPSLAPPRWSRCQPRAAPRSPRGCRGPGRPCRGPARSRAGRPRRPSRNRSSALARRDPPGDDLAGPRRARPRAGGGPPAARFDPGDVEQLGDQPGDPVGVGVDRLQHDALLVVGEPVPLGQQRGGEALDAGQRRAQFVGDGGDQVGAAALQARPRPVSRRRPTSRRSHVAASGSRT